ncbi:MAG: response regulator [Candidatus Hydrogenedentes bacterium]|nr:response regulator [Candidatus Hydrogenedentota bacterium]
MAYVLIVDDDEDFVSAVETVLSADGHEVGKVYDTTHAMEIIEERTPDLLILDVMFPENNEAGFDLARSIRHNHKDLDSMPILMLTAVNVKFPLGFSAKDIDDHWLPVNDFIEKPVDFDVLREKVKELILGDSDK